MMGQQTQKDFTELDDQWNNKSYGKIRTENC